MNLLIYLWIFAVTFHGFVTSIELVLFDNWNLAENVCSSAIDDAKAKGECTAKTIQINRQAGCNGYNSVKASVYAINAVASRPSLDGLDFVFVGPTCPFDIRTIGNFAELWKSPVIGYEPMFEDRGIEELTSVINVAQFSVGGVAETLVQLLKELGQSEISLVGRENVYPNGQSLGKDLKVYNDKMMSFIVKQYIEVNENDDDYRSVDKMLRNGPRTIVVCSGFYDIYSALYNLAVRRLGGFGFYIVVILNKPPEEVLGQPNIKSLLYGANSFVIAPLQKSYKNSLSFMHQVIPNLADEQFTSFLRIYHACYAYCAGSMNGVETQTDNYHVAMKGLNVKTKYGNFTFDESGSVLTDYAIYSVLTTDMTFKILMELRSSTKPCDMFNCFQLSPNRRDDEQWKLKDAPPPEQCVYSDSCGNSLPYFIVLGLIVVVVIAGAALYIKNRRHKINVYKLTWKVPRDSLKIITNKNADAKMQRELERRDLSDKSANLISRRRAFGTYALVGTQRAEFISFKQIKKIPFTEPLLDYLYNLKQLQNDNLTKFFGIQMNDMENVTVLHALVERGTLEEFYADREGFDMDNTFKSAFMRDILKGLQYLHKSNIGYHGFLLASTCLIDINWVLKLTLYGVSNFICDSFDSKSIRLGDHAPHMLSYAQYVCFAPEHLKEYDPTGTLPPRIVRGSAAGDIYSVGMIIYSMVERNDPYDLNNSLVAPKPQMIVDIMENNLMPRIDGTHIQEQMLLDKCKECWDRDPVNRPTIRNLIDTISAVYPSSKGNLVDQMIKMSEKNADALEEMVAARTAALAIAQEATMRLLNEMLPAKVAEDLKNGIILPPRSYESATVMFVQICDFAAILRKSLPDQVIQFLNDIFDQFDTVIKRHDAYKVETTGETYMVASGVPDENGGRHIFEVAEVSLEIRDISYTYRLKNMKNYRLRVRIGFHSGPIAAGVIGIRSPRYCLFGDTVNFASRMQSNCPPNQIQTSEITAKMLFQSHEYKLVKRGIVHVKGKGEVNCYWLNEHVHEEVAAEPPSSAPNPLKPSTSALIPPSTSPGSRSDFNT